MVAWEGLKLQNCRKKCARVRPFLRYCEWVNVPKPLPVLITFRRCAVTRLLSPAPKCSHKNVILGAVL